MKDIITIGDATVDTFIEVEQATVNCSIDKDECLLCLNYAEKIPIRKLVRKVAGNAANVAVGSARLGLDSAFWTVLGDDEAARMIMAKMREEKVETKYVQKKKGTDSNFTVVLNYQGERTQLVYQQPRKYNLPNNLEKAKFVYLTAMGETHKLAYAELLLYLLKTKTKLAYNPGSYQITCKEKICNDILPYTEILFVNKEEALMILTNHTKNGHAKYKQMSVKYARQLLKELNDLGPEIVVITDGNNGSYALADNVYYYLGIFPGSLIERTGAGDAYASGFLSAIVHGKATSEAMVWGTFNAWSVVQYVGPIDGLLRLNAVKKMIKGNPKFKAKII